MTRNEIIELANKAYGIDDGKPFHPSALLHLEIFAKLVAQHEREACAKVCDSLEEQCEKLLVPDEKWPTPSDCANIIRERGQA
jgi:hypothetical protein